MPKFTEPAGAADPFVRRALTLAVVAVAALAAWQLRGIVTMAFGAVVLAVAFRTLADAARDRLRAPEPLAMALSVGLVAAVLGLAVWFAVATVATQAGSLSRQVPAAIRRLDETLAALPQGAMLSARLHEAIAGFPKLAARVFAGAPATFGGGVVVVLAAIFLAADARRYASGSLLLVPPQRRQRAAYVLQRIGAQLRRWMAGKLITMTTSGTLCSLGLWALGVEAPFAVGLAGAVMCFVPNFGSIVATALAMAVAALTDPLLSIWVAVLYWAVHFVEGALVSPLVQQRAAKVPPVFTLFAILVFAALIGPGAVFLAGPLTVLSMTLVQTLYLEGLLGEPPPAERRLHAVTPLPSAAAAAD